MKSIQIKTQYNTYKPLLALLALIGILLASTHPVVYANDMTPEKILSLTNQSRQEAGLKNLTLNDALSFAAKAKAKDMIANDYFAHTSPKGLSPWHWMDKSGYGYRYAGENLAINYETAGSEHKAWMKSPTHRANILSAQYTEVGIATTEGKIDGEMARITVVMFGQPKGVVAPAPKQEPVIAPEAVKGVADESTVLPVETLVPENTTTTLPNGVQEPLVNVPQIPAFVGLWESYRFFGLGVLGVVFMLSASYLFYRDALEYVALERGVRLALSSNGTLGMNMTDSALTLHQPIIVKLE